MSIGWTHACCDDCWKAQHGDRTPVRLVEPDQEQCCWCGMPTRSGIYLRHAPTLSCAHALWAHSNDKERARLFPDGPPA